MSVLVLAMLTLLSGQHAKIHRLHRWFPLCINRFLKYKHFFFPASMAVGNMYAFL